MATTNLTHTQQGKHEERQDPYMRLVYAIGILLTIFGHFIPGEVKWNIVGIALVIFYWIY
ncbi:MAG TPA: hypothetical protein VHT28_13370 [Silvibacterium sp.]|jgi:hypothetical protein|nr:hypothetical protein [Silvibacterium sp.]